MMFFSAPNDKNFIFLMPDDLVNYQNLDENVWDRDFRLELKFISNLK